MSKIVLLEMPAYGHVNPTLSVMQELVRRGEQVIYYNTEEFRPEIESTGATFQPYPTGVLTSTDLAEATQSGDATRVVRRIFRATETLLPFVLDELSRQQPDLIALDANALWGYMAAKTRNLPTVSLMTTLIPSMGQAKMSAREWFGMLGPMLPNLPGLLSDGSRLMRQFGKATFPQRPTFPVRGDLNVVFIPRDLQPQNPLVDESFRFVGPTINPETRRGAVQFEAAGSGPLIYISLGTLHVGSTDFYQQCFAAFADVPAQFVLSVGKQTDIPALGKIPSNFTVLPFVPQLEVLQQASVFITHGGMNSVLEGLYFGVPLILIPQQFEQLMIALHVAEQGAGLVLREHLSGKRILSDQLRKVLNHVLTEPGFRDSALQMHESLRETGGYRQAADEIQKLIVERQSATM